MGMTADAARTALLEALPMPALLVDSLGVVQQGNGAFSAAFAAGESAAQELAGKSLEFVAQWLCTADLLTAAVASVVREARAQRLAWESLEPRAGEPLPGTVMLTPVRDAEGAVAWVLLLFMDMSPQTEVDALACASCASVTVGRAMGNAAHEINNALSLVTGYTELRLGTELDAEIRGDLLNVLDGSGRAARTSEHLGRFARRLRVQVGKLDANALVGDCVALVGRTFERSGIMLIEDLDPDLPAARFHSGQAQLVVLSLLFRSLLRLVARQRCGITRISTATGTEGIAVIVEDESDCGFDAGTSVAQRDIGELRGRLLSLAACRQLARRHGGDLLLAAQGEISRVTLRLPEEPVDG